MKAVRSISRIRIQHSKRRGAATVELAMVLPLLLTLVLGVAEFSRAINSYNQMFAAVREGGRLAAMDFSEFVNNNQTANQKVERDIRAFLSASGLPGDDMTITITEPDSDVTFNLADSNNYLRNVRITASIPYSSISSLPMRFLGDTTLSASMVYRKGRVDLVQ
ncbi:MAG: pilus assembly protein [Planctomycetaceae bacterium]|nr:pilus assembly protein [Planctomycetaceae bacterium]